MKLAKELLETPGTSEEVRLLCKTLMDTQTVFQVHAPVIAAVKRMLKSNGDPVREFTEIHNRELVPAAVALHRFDAQLKREGWK